MSERAQILHAVPGRWRVGASGWSEEERQHTRQRIRAVPGVRSVDANPRTGNLLIRFDPRTTPEHLLTAAVTGDRPGVRPPCPSPRAGIEARLLQEAGLLAPPRRSPLAGAVAAAAWGGRVVTCLAERDPLTLSWQAVAFDVIRQLAGVLRLGDRLGLLVGPPVARLVCRGVAIATDLLAGGPLGWCQGILKTVLLVHDLRTAAAMSPA